MHDLNYSMALRRQAELRCEATEARLGRAANPLQRARHSRGNPRPKGDAAPAPAASRCDPDGRPPNMQPQRQSSARGTSLESGTAMGTAYKRVAAYLARHLAALPYRRHRDSHVEAGHYEDVAPGMDTQSTEMRACLVDPPLDGQATTLSAIVDSRDAFDDRLSRLVGPKLVVDGNPLSPVIARVAGVRRYARGTHPAAGRVCTAFGSSRRECWRQTRLHAMRRRTNCTCQSIPGTRVRPAPGSGITAPSRYYSLSLLHYRIVPAQASGLHTLGIGLWGFAQRDRSVSATSG
jgi:hypothetical protein